MTWFKIDDGLYDHPKWIGASLEARALWLQAGIWCSRHLTDGLVPADALETIGFGAHIRPLDRIPEVAAELVDRRLWSKAGRRGWKFHGWLEVQPSRAEVEKQRGRWARTKRLYRDPTLVAAVKARDGDRCRYCARSVSWTNRHAGGAVLDHVDPHIPEPACHVLENVVVSCRACNARKGENTPEQAGMVLLPSSPAVPVSRDSFNRLARVPNPCDGTTDGTDRAGTVQTGPDRAGTGPSSRRLVGPGPSSVRSLFGAPARSNES